MIDSFSTSRIKYIRINVFKFSQEELAKELKCSQVNISAIEKGTTGKFFRTLLTYLSEKNINLNWIFKEDNSLESIRNTNDILL